MEDLKNVENKQGEKLDWDHSEIVNINFGLENFSSYEKMIELENFGKEG